jgi:hypothetical protein
MRYFIIGRSLLVLTGHDSMGITIGLLYSLDNWEEMHEKVFKVESSGKRSPEMP